MTEFTFKELLAPVSMERFFGDDYARRPVHYRAMPRNPAAYSHGPS
jgi:hypothetical protein